MKFRKSANKKDSERFETFTSGLFKGLGGTILLWFLGIFLLPMLVVGYVSYDTSRKHLLEAPESELMEIATIKKV